jgi:hypothetical protein
MKTNHLFASAQWLLCLLWLRRRFLPATWVVVSAVDSVADWAVGSVALEARWGAVPTGH